MNPTQMIAQIFQQYLGRMPNQYEVAGFSQAMQNGILDPIGLTTFLQSTAEFQQRQAPQIAQQYAQQLQPLIEQASTRTLGKAYDAAVGRYAKLGRPDSSGLGSSFANAAADLAAQNSQFVGQGVGDYLSNVYGGLAGQQIGYGANYGQGQQAYAQQNRNFLNQRELNQQQDEIYNKYLNMNLKQARQNQWFELAGAGLQAGAKAYAGA